MHVSDLFNVIADALSIPRSTALMYRRALHKAGLLSTGARGRNAPDATCRDLATAILAMVASPRPASCPEYVRDFGALPSRTKQNYSTVTEWLALPNGHTCLDMLSRFFEALGSDDFARSVINRDADPHFSRQQLIDLAKPDIVIADTNVHVGIGLGECEFVYHNHDFVEAGIKGRAAIREYMRKRAGAYYRNLKSTKTVDEDGLELIIEGFHGKRFADRLSDILNPEEN